MDDESSLAGRGRLEVICGCMFSGKTERLVAAVLDARSRGVTAAVFKHARDDRYGRSHLVTHSGQRLESKSVARGAEIVERAGEARLIAIDEGQFFGPDLVTACRELTAKGCDVIVAGLDLDSWGLPFGPMPDIQAAADRVTRTRAVCTQCGQVADHTQRIVPIEDDNMVGGAEAYEPRCRNCFRAPPAELRR